MGKKYCMRFFFVGNFIMPPTSKKLRRHIGLGTCVRPSVRQSVRPSVRYAYSRSRIVRDIIVKFGTCMLDKYEN